MAQSELAPPIVVRDLVKKFGSVDALSGISFEVASGEVVAMLGPNGAGKTTSISLMLGLRHPTSGTVRIYGRDPQELASRVRMGVMLQESGAPPTLKVREILTWYSHFYPQAISVEEAIRYAGLTEKAEALIGTLSGGQKQRLFFALAVVGNPDVIFLDEPTVAMDVEARHAFWDEMRVLKAQHKSIILTTHYIEEADAIADRVIVINRGKIIADGTPSAIKKNVGGTHVRFRATDLTEAAAQRLPGVTKVTFTNGAFDLYTTTAEPTVRALFAQSSELTDLEVVGAGLEEAFLELTHN